MDNRTFLGFVVLVAGLLIADVMFGWGATVALARWFFAFIDWTAFWRYL